MRQSYKNLAALSIALLIASLRSVSAQGTPDIVWQGAHTGFIRYTAFSPDGQQLASGGDDKKNNLWRVADGTLVRTITQCSGLHCTGPTVGFYSPDSQQLATSGLKFWRISDGTLLRTLGIGGTVAFSPDWQFIASSITTSSYPSQSRNFTLFRADGSQVWTKPSVGGGATVFSPDGQRIASIGFQGIDILQASDGTLVRNIVGPRGTVLAFSRDGQFLATNGGSGGSYRYDETIKIFRVSDGSLVRTFTATGSVSSIVFTPDGQTMIAASSDSNEDPANGFVPATGTIRLWRVSDGALLKTYDQNTGTSARALSVSPDGKLFSYSHDSTVIIARIPATFCDFSISPASVNLPASGGIGTVNVSAPAGCSWSAVSRVSWITITGPNSGTGNGTIAYSASGGVEGITGLLIIAEQAFPIHLGADSCTYTVSPTNVTWSSYGGTASVGVQTPSGCGWTAASNDSWISITKINHDSGNGGLTYAVAPNSGPARTGTLTVAGQTVTIEQVTTPCSYAVSPTSQSFGSGGGPGNINITAMNGCPWTATTDSSWIILGLSNGSGSGSTTVSYWVNASDTTATRTGTITAAGQVITIDQVGITCDYDVSPSNRSFTSDGGSAYINMAASDACSWNATSNADWITVTSGGSGSGWGTIYYSVAANGSGSYRTGTISLAGQTFTVYQTSEATQGSPDIVWTRTGHLLQVNAVAFSPDGQLLASASDDHTVKLWRVTDGFLLATLTGHFEEVTSVAFSHNGEMLASGSMDRNIKLWRVSDQSLIRTMGGYEFILGIAFSPDDVELTSGGGYSTNDIKVWRLSDGENISITHDQLGSTNSVAYSPNGQFLAAGKANSVATLRNFASWNVDWLGHRGGVNFVAFSPDGQRLATASDDQSASLWQVASGLPLFNLNGPSGFVKSVGFSPDGEMLIAAGQDYGASHGAILFWRVSDGSLLRAYTQQTSTAVYSAQFSPDGNFFAYGREDGSVVLARNALNVAPTPTPTPTPTSTPTPTPESTPTATPTPESTPTATPTPEFTPTATPTPEFTPTATPTPESTPKATPTPESTPTATPTPEFTPKATATPESTPTPTATATVTQTPASTPTVTPEATPTATIAPTPSPTATETPGESPTATPSSSPTASPMPASQPLNIATRGRVESGDNAMIGGFIITGTMAKKVIVRAIGPSLQSSLSGALTDPVLELRGADGSLIRQNDNWKDDAVQATEIEANHVAPTHNLESAMVATLPPGNYTAAVSGKNGATGVGLVEVYDLNQSADSKLANISTRGVVQSAENVLIGGFILGGGNANAKVLVRAIGPSLANVGVTNSLSDPTLELRDGNGVLLRSNDNWKEQQRTEIEATRISPAMDSEAAIIADLPPGLYTTIVAGKGPNGVGLIEIYNLAN
jgi:WD40 repeat protein